MEPTQTTINSIPLNGLAYRLVKDGLLEESTAHKALENARIKKSSLVMHLVENKILSPLQIAKVATQDFGLPLLNLDVFEKEQIPTDLVTEKLIRQHHALPLFKRHNHLFLAVSDPSNLNALDEIRFHTGLHIHAILVEEDKLEKLIEGILSAKADTALGDLSDADLDVLDISAGDDELEHETGTDTDDAPIVRFVHKILLDAINKGASDIHFEPYEKICRVRFRLDGLLYEIANPPINLANRITSRLKVMSRLDISERRIPQDGRLKMKLSHKRSIDFRVSTCPTVNGEKVVMRILDPSSANLGIEALGFHPDQKELFLKTIHQPQGMVLVTGPTGSGKTVTLYTALNILNSVDKNISTAEDPVEIHVSGVNQVNINNKTGLTFATALRAFLRQDPDIIMVGEMRDLETAEIGVKAAQTGHLVLSTLHTNSAPETLSRLVNMGVAPYNIATSVNLIIAQRLARRLCAHCKKPIVVPPEILLKEGFNQDSITKVQLYAPEGCELCTNGYKGRIGLYEIFSMSEALGQIIMSGGSSMDIATQAKKEGMLTLRQSGLMKIAEGVTSLEEVTRVTNN